MGKEVTIWGVGPKFTVFSVLCLVLALIVKNHAVYTFDEVASVFARAGPMRCFYERWRHGPYHHTVLQKADGAIRR
jgi:hypothetical protein